MTRGKEISINKIKVQLRKVKRIDTVDVALAIAVVVAVADVVKYSMKMIKNEGRCSLVSLNSFSRWNVNKVDSFVIACIFFPRNF